MWLVRDSVHMEPAIAVSPLLLTLERGLTTVSTVLLRLYGCLEVIHLYKRHCVWDRVCSVHRREATVRGGRVPVTKDARTERV